MLADKTLSVVSLVTASAALGAPRTPSTTTTTSQAAASKPSGATASKRAWGQGTKRTRLEKAGQDDGPTDNATPPKRRRLSRLLRYRAPTASSRLRLSGSVDTLAAAAAAATHNGGAAAPWVALPAEVLSMIVNGCDALDRAFLHPRWRVVCRAVCRTWRHAVENPALPDAVRIGDQLTDPRPSLRVRWVKGAVLCASVLAEKLRCGPERAPEAVVAWASQQGEAPVGPFVVAASLVASARPDAVAYGFSKHVSRAAVSSLGRWLRCAGNRARDHALRPPVTTDNDVDRTDDGPHPDAWWTVPRAGGPPVRPWEGVRHVVGGCARAAFSALLLRVAARHGSVNALDMLVSVGEPPCGTADAAFEAAAGGHAAFVVRLLMLVAAGGDRARAAVVCYQAWLGAAAGGHVHVMHALLDAESGRGTLATALWRGRCMADGSARHPRTASHTALAHDRAGYFEVLRDRERASDENALQFAKAHLVEALRVGALGVARWIVDDVRSGGLTLPTATTVTTEDDPANNAVLAKLGSRAVVEVVVDGRGPRECAHRTMVWMRDVLGAEPGPGALGVLVRSAHAFRWARADSAAARGRLSAGRYARLLDLLVDVVDVWPHVATTEIEHDDQDEEEDIAADVDPYYMCAGRDGGGQAYGACVVRLLVERASHGRIAGDRYDRKHAGRRALSALDRMAVLVMRRHAHSYRHHDNNKNNNDDDDPLTARQRQCAVVDPWTVAAARVAAEIGVMERTGRSPMRSIDAILGLATLACRCLLSSTVGAAVAGDGSRLPAVVFGLATRLSDKGTPLDDDRARIWRQWCRLPAERSADGSEFDPIGAWAERIATHTVFS